VICWQYNCLNCPLLAIGGIFWSVKKWGTGGTNPIRGADTQPGDDDDVDRAMGNVMPSDWRIWNNVVALSGRRWRHIHCFSPSCASAPPFAIDFTPVPHYWKIKRMKMNHTNVTKYFCFFLANTGSEILTSDLSWGSSWIASNYELVCYEFSMFYHMPRSVEVLWKTVSKSHHLILAVYSSGCVQGPQSQHLSFHYHETRNGCKWLNWL
jgi:hypothetical protein